MYYTTYEITNEINNKNYFGVHKTKILDGNYMGSGTAIKWAINKYGLNAFSKIINGVWKSEEISYLIESWLVNEEVVKDKNNYNLILGGSFYIRNKEIKEKMRKAQINKKHLKSTKLKMSKAHKNKILSQSHKNNISNSKVGIPLSKMVKKNMSKAKTGCKLSKQHKNNISKGLYKQTGLNGGRKINIYDENNNIMFKTEGNFKFICIKNKLPEIFLRRSFKNNGEKLYSWLNAKPSNKNKKFIGWYAILF